MRKLVIVLLAVAVLGSLAPAAWAQAPAPKVTITGLFDQITSMSRNLLDGNYSRDGDKEWYARTRFRPDFEFAVGRTKAVLGLEIDLTYGQSGPCAAGPGKGVSNQAVQGAVNGATATPCINEKSGATASAGINSDVTGVIEIKWAYTEFDLTGKDSLMPFIPVGTVARAGIQPFANLGNYKVVYANGDFAGLSMVTTFAPNLKTNLTFVQVDEQVGPVNTAASGDRGTNNAATTQKLTRGDDYAVIFSVDWTVMKGLDIKPMYSFFFGQGVTAGSSRRSPVNIGTYTGNTLLSQGVGTLNSAAALGSGNASGDTAYHENRHTMGIDARWRYGAFSLDPTILYQWGSFDSMGQDNKHALPSKLNGDINAWLLDIQAGYQLGPLLLEGRYIYSTGNKARDNLAVGKRYFEPLDMDTSYYAGWANILALGVDYFNGGGANNGGMDTGIGYDRYGRNQFGLRATYNLTPALAFYTVVSPTWTAEQVDTKTGTNGTSRTFVSDQSFTKGNSSYIGTEVDLGMTWRFAPNAAFDLVGAILFAGDALNTTECTGDGQGAVPVNCPVANTQLRKANDAYTAAARIRLSF